MTARCLSVGRTQSGKVLLPEPPPWCPIEEADQWLRVVLDILHDTPPHPRSPTHPP